MILNEVLTVHDEEDENNEQEVIVFADGARNKDRARIGWVVLDAKNFKVLEKGKCNVEVDEEATVACVEYVSVVAGWSVAEKHKEKVMLNDNSEICKRVRNRKIEPLGKYGDIESFLNKNDMSDIDIIKINKKMEEWKLKALNVKNTETYF